MLQLTESDGNAFLVGACMLHNSSLVICTLGAWGTCMNTTHIPGVETAIDEDIGDGITVEDAVVVGKHPASSISEQQSPKL